MLETLASLMDKLSYHTKATQQQLDLLIARPTLDDQTIARYVVDGVVTEWHPPGPPPPTQRPWWLIGGVLLVVFLAGMLVNQLAFRWLAGKQPVGMSQHQSMPAKQGAKR